MKDQNQSLIREQWALMKTRTDLAAILTLANKELYEEGWKPVEVKQLTYYANPEICKTRYNSFTIPKKNGGKRLIHSPVRGLKSILKALNYIFQIHHSPHESSMGFEVEKSVVDNARLHTGQNYVYNIDLKDFFHSFNRNRVKWALMNTPFNLGKDREELAFFIACLCTHPFEIDGEIKTVLPQGSPASPILTNILSARLDRKLMGLANRFGLKYSRYADDITFSSPHNVYKSEPFKKELKRIISGECSLEINHNKTRLQKQQHRQEATGLVINEKVNLRREYYKQVRMYLYYWERYGAIKATELLKNDIVTLASGNGNIVNVDLRKVLEGKISYMGMIRGRNDELYLSYKKRYERLINREEMKKAESIDLEAVVNTLLNKGIIEGLKLYSRFKES